MAKVTVYDPDGSSHQKEPIDARECCESLGWSMESKLIKDGTDKSPKLEVNVASSEIKIIKKETRGRKPKPTSLLQDND